MGQVAVVILICFFYGVHALPFGSSSSAQPDVDSEKPAAICRMTVPKWIFRPYDEHFSLQTALQRYRNETDPEVRAEKTRGLANLLEVRAEMELLHQKMQALICNGTVLKQYFLHAFTCEVMHGERCRHKCETEVGRYKSESLEAPYGVQRCTTYAAHLSCIGAKLAEICGGRHTEFDMARLTLIEAQQSMVAVTRDKRQPSHCGAETVAAMYKLIFMKAPKGTEDIFGL
ncbi:unnamed protein product, partial [Mesorhabditis spiculigera]